MSDLAGAVEWLLGLGQDELAIRHMAVRAVVVYIIALGMLQLGEKRFLGKNTAFDVILGIILGSVVSRAVTGNAPFFPTLAAGLVLVLMHWLLAAISFYSDWFGPWVKGRPRVLVKDGEIDWKAMRRSHISENDLMSALRSQAQVERVEDVQEARLERSGDISVLKRSGEPTVLEVSVADGVQTVRIQLG